MNYNAVLRTFKLSSSANIRVIYSLISILIGLMNAALAVAFAGKNHLLFVPRIAQINAERLPHLALLKQKRRPKAPFFLYVLLDYLVKETVPLSSKACPSAEVYLTT